MNWLSTSVGAACLGAAAWMGAHAPPRHPDDVRALPTVTNAWGHYERALAALPRCSPALVTRLRRCAAEGWTADGAELSAYLGKAAEALVHARRAAEMERTGFFDCWPSGSKGRARFPAGSSADGWERLVLSFQVEARRNEQNGDLPAALEALRTILAIAAHLGGDETTNLAMKRFQWRQQQTVFAHLARLCESDGVPPSCWRATQSLLDRLLREKACLELVLANELERFDGLATDHLGALAVPSPERRRARALSRQLQSQLRAAFRDALLTCSPAAFRAHLSRVADEARLEAARADAPARLSSAVRALVVANVKPLAELIERERAHRELLRLTATAVAVLLYRDEEGRLPETLGALGSEHAARWSGQPCGEGGTAVGYERGESGARLFLRSPAAGPGPTHIELR